MCVGQVGPACQHLTPTDSAWPLGTYLHTPPDYPHAKVNMHACIQTTKHNTCVYVNIHTNTHTGKESTHTLSLTQTQTQTHTTNTAYNVQKIAESPTLRLIVILSLPQHNSLSFHVPHFIANISLAISSSPSFILHSLRHLHHLFYCCCCFSLDCYSYSFSSLSLSIITIWLPHLDPSLFTFYSWLLCEPLSTSLVHHLKIEVLINIYTNSEINNTITANSNNNKTNNIITILKLATDHSIPDNNITKDYSINKNDHTPK